MKRAHTYVIFIVWVAATLSSLASSVNICGKTDEPILISYTADTSVTSIQWNLNGATFYISTLETDGLTCIPPPPPVPADHEVLCNVTISGFNYFGLNILKPKDGDVYHTTDPNDNRTIIVPEPATVTVDITSTVTTDTVLPGTDMISMECQISSCTKPQPNIKWQYTTDGGTTRTTILNTYIQSTLDATGCTGTLTKINSKITISKDSVPITAPLRIVCVLSYDVCPDIEYENITDYTITIDDAPTTSLTTPTSPTVITSQTSLTSQTSTSDLPTNNGSDSVNDTLIIIIVFSCIAGIIVIVIVVCCCCFLIRHYRSDKRKEHTDL